MLQDISALKPNVISEPYMNNSPLWSLSYEWWFYMLFFPAVTYVKNVQLRTGLVYLVSITACLIYVYWPTFIPRLLMYLGIWWSGVFLAEEYLKGKSIDIRSVKLPSVGLMIMAVILCINAWLYYLNSKTYSIGLHPLLEFRHMLFAFIAIHVAILWRKVNWFGFDFIFKPFVILSPISYVIYISHYYLIAHASYFSFINQPIVEFMLYFVVLIVFSSLIEVKLYPAVKRFFRL